MGKETEFIRAEVDQAFISFDNQLDAFFHCQDKPGLLAFLENYMRKFPTPADCIRSCLPPDTFASGSDLKGFLKEQYKAHRMRNMDIPQYEALAAQLEAQGEMTPAQAFQFRQDCTEALASFHSSEWRTGLDAKKGYQFLSRADLSANIRNVIFHLAFALDLPQETVSQLLTKGLLQQDFNPKDHKEVIYWWCLKKKIPYEKMVREYFAYYHSVTFDRDYQNQKIITAQLKDTDYLIDSLQTIADISNYGSDANMQKRAFTDYLRKLKMVEAAVAEASPEPEQTSAEDPFDADSEASGHSLTRKTPRRIFWESFLDFPLELQGADGQSLKTFDDLREEKGKKVSEEGKNPDRHYFSADIRFRLEILEQFRKSCSHRNEEPLLPQPLLKELFDGISYSEDIVINRCSGKAPISRNLLIATMFIGFFSDDAYVKKELPDEVTALEYFEELVSYDLDSCGMYPLYLRNPFELFLALCFLSKDPLAYFMRSWAQAMVR